ncbi:protein of unknown function (plasmid) [Caballeronia sp. S22]
MYLSRRVDTLAERTARAQCSREVCRGDKLRLDELAGDIGRFERRRSAGERQRACKFVPSREHGRHESGRVCIARAGLEDRQLWWSVEDGLAAPLMAYDIVGRGLVEVP